MTAGERSVLAEVLDIVKRVDGRVERIDARVRAVEEYVTTDKVKAEVKAEAAQSTRLNRAQILTAAGIVGSFVLGLINHIS